MDWTDGAVQRLYAEVGGRIRKARSARGQSQLELARAVGLTRSSIANIEAGRQRSAVHVLVLVAQALDVPPADLIPDIDAFDVDHPDLDLEGQPDPSQNFVNAALRRAMGRLADDAE